jgi:hypothetical protein
MAKNLTGRRHSEVEFCDVTEFAVHGITAEPAGGVSRIPAHRRDKDSRSKRDSNSWSPGHIELCSRAMPLGCLRGIGAHEPAAVVQPDLFIAAPFPAVGGPRVIWTGCGLRRSSAACASRR